jgi:hypothetical protein
MQHVLEHQFKGIRRKFEVLVWLVIFEKNKKLPFDSGCNVMKVEVVLKKMGVGKKMMPKCELLKSIPLHGQRLYCKICIYELEDHVWEKNLSSC